MQLVNFLKISTFCLHFYYLAMFQLSSMTKDIMELTTFILICRYHNKILLELPKVFSGLIIMSSCFKYELEHLCIYIIIAFCIFVCFWHKKWNVKCGSLWMKHRLDLKRIESLLSANLSIWWICCFKNFSIILVTSFCMKFGQTITGNQHI